MYGSNSSWYQFNKIVESASSTNEVNSNKAYGLMDDNFNYAVYDPVNDKVNYIESAGIDNGNPNHSWMLADVNGKKYLYNLGAKKFAVASTDGTAFTLTDLAGDVAASDGENGIILNGRNDTQWHLVENNQLNAYEGLNEIITAVNMVADSKQTAEQLNLKGQRVGSHDRGIRIIRYSDGTARKVVK